MTYITQVEVTNFRNIKHLVLNLNKGASIITGKNKLGKSNVLNAINWLITDTLLTDKYGVGENDIDSIVPNNHQKGEHTEVSITLDTNTTYTKIYKVGYSSDGTKVNKHTTEYKRNGVPVSTQREFYNDLYKVFGFNPTFTSLKINEVRLMTNPLYALLIIDPKELRKLLVAMGCTVSNEELYQMGFEFMRPLEQKFAGRWEDVRIYAKEKLKTAKELKDTHEAQFRLFNETEEYDESVINKFKNKREELVKERADIQNTSNDNSIKELELKIKSTEIEEQALINARNTELDAKIKQLQEKVNNAEEEAQREYEAATKNITDALSEKRKAYAYTLSQIQALQDERNPIYRDYYLCDSQIENLQNQINQKSDLLAHILNPENEIECPYCHATFVHTKDNLSVDELKNSIYTLQKQFETVNKDKEEKQNKLATLDTRIKDLKNNNYQKEITDLEYELKAYPKKEINVSEYNTQISNLILEKSKPLVNSKLPELKHLLTEMINNATETKKSKIERINLEIKALDDEITNEMVKKNDYDRKLSLIETLEYDRKNINDCENWLGKVNQFIHTMVKMINDKAKKITGFDFVMLEENLSNGNLNEVCYATVDDVPFKDLNTADKVKYGIKFLEVCRSIAANKTGIENDLPILGDRFESISSVETIKGYTTKQLICTRVNESEEMRVE